MRFPHVLLGLYLTACYSTGEGESPPLDRVYFPVGVAVSSDARHLYLANSDFDLQYNAGSVQSLDLERIRSLVPRQCQSDEDCGVLRPFCEAVSESNASHCVSKRGSSTAGRCAPLELSPPAQRATVPGLCDFVDLVKPQDGGRPIQIDSVAIGAFATDMALRTVGEEKSERLFVPVRGESSLHFIDVDGKGRLSCGQSGSHSSCDKQHRVGTDPDDNTRGVRMPPEPFAMAITEDARAIAITHQTTGEVSLLVQDPGTWAQGPVLEFVASGLAMRPVAIAAIPDAELTRYDRDQVGSTSDVPDPWPPGFLVGYKNSNQLDLLRFFSDASSTPARPFLQPSASLILTANSVNQDIRGIAYDDSGRRACEAECRQADTLEPSDLRGCLLACATLPIPVYLAARSPASLVIGQTQPDTSGTPNRDLPRFFDTIPLPTGPSRVFVGKVLTPEGMPETRVFVVCFDSRRIAIYDPERREIERWITTGRGPHALAFDYREPDPENQEPGYAYAYLAHFTDSYLGVIQLDRRQDRSYGQIVLTLAPAIPPRAEN